MPATLDAPTRLRLTPTELRIRDLLGRLLEQLPEPYTSVLRLVELDGESFAETGVALQLSPATVRLLYAEGRRRLRHVVLTRSETGLLL